MLLFHQKHDFQNNFKIPQFNAIHHVRENSSGGGIYRPPSSVVKYFSENLFSSLDLINKEVKVCYARGDFNINVFKSNTQTRDFLNILYF